MVLEKVKAAPPSLLANLLCDIQRMQAAAALVAAHEAEDAEASLAASASAELAGVDIPTRSKCHTAAAVGAKLSTIITYACIYIVMHCHA